MKAKYVMIFGYKIIYFDHELTFNDIYFDSIIIKDDTVAFVLRKLYVLGERTLDDYIEHQKLMEKEEREYEDD